MAYRAFKDLTRKTASDKILDDKAFNDIAKNPKYDGYQRPLASRFYKFFDEKSALLADKSASGGAIEDGIMSNKELSEELHKPISKFEKRKVCSSFIDNIWGADVAYMQLITKFNKGIRFLICALDSFSIYAWVISLKDKKGLIITNIFQNIFDESNRKPNKICVDKVSGFYKR